MVRVNACSTTIDWLLPVLNTIAWRPAGRSAMSSGENVATWWAATGIGSIVTSSSVSGIPRGTTVTSTSSSVGL